MNKYIDIKNQIQSLVEDVQLDQGAAELLTAAQKHNISVYALNLLIECQSNAVNAMVLNQDGISYEVLPQKEVSQTEIVDKEKSKEVSEVTPKLKKPKQAKDVESKPSAHPILEKKKLVEAKLKFIEPEVLEVKHHQK